ncbi:hypothetical protein T11_9391 [Trichinella zimbabwensis]|uniref:Uncharacterized protein n=1 Tax=Trichinella zimbabwensis TaxID=268475 RepID=A0A0V1GXZ6_9BILA|nr:hypothetical protein T11_9391 [Trichinella zimbabwensis]
MYGDGRRPSNWSDFFHKSVTTRAFFDVCCIGTSSVSTSSSASNSPAGSSSSSGSSGTYSVLLTPSPESPAVGGRTMSLTGCLELDTASRASSIVVSLIAHLPSKLSSFTDIEDGVAALVEGVRRSKKIICGSLEKQQLMSSLRVHQTSAFLLRSVLSVTS